MRILAVGALLALLCSVAQAQDISGTWQGTLHAGKDLREVLKISKSGNGGWDGMLYSIDQKPGGIAVTGMSLQGETLTFRIPQLGGSAEGKLGADGKSIAGRWSQGAALPLDFALATEKTAWAFDTAAPQDTTKHTAQYVTVDGGVKLEVLDWGGTGRPLVFLAGLGGTAHALDALAPKFTGKYHAYGITRRGYGASDKPDPATTDYSADRLADDVLGVIGKLGLKRPIIAGHSMAGEEMSSIGSRHPEKIAGLIYLDAGYAYALYAPGNTVPLGSNLIIEAKDLEKKLARLRASPGISQELPGLIQDLQASLPQFEKDLAATQTELQASGPLPATPDTPQGRIANAIMNGEQKYTGTGVPTLALYAIYAVPDKAPAAARATVERHNAAISAQADAFAAANPKAHVVRLENAEHAIWVSNPEAVEREMNAFMDSLPPP